MTKATTKPTTKKSTKSIKSAKASRNRPALARRRAAVAVAVVIAVGVGFYFHKQASSSPSNPADTVLTDAESAKIFRNYLIKQAKTKVSNQEVTASQVGTQSTASSKVVFDAANKRISGSTTMECSDTNSGGDKSFKATTQIDNQGTFIRIEDVSGTNTNSAGHVADLSRVYTKAKGKWYSLGKPKPTLQAQIDNGVFVFNDGVMAPGYNAQKIADALLEARAFDYQLVPQDDGTYQVNLTVNKNNYVLALKKALPNIPTIDMIIDSVMGESDNGQADKTLVIKKDGSLVSYLSTAVDECTTLLYNYVAPGPANRGRFVGPLAQTSHVRPVGSITPPPQVKSALPIAKLDEEAAW